MAIINKTVKSSGGDYASLSAAIAGIEESLDNIAGNDIIIECSSFEDTGGAAAIGADWDVDLLTIQVPVLERHNGARGNGYRLTCQANGEASIRINGALCNITLNGISTSNNIGTYSTGIWIENTNAGNTFIIKNCLVYDCPELNILVNGPGTCYIINNISYGSAVGIGTESSATGTLYVYNNTILNASIVGIYRENGTVIVKNNYAGNNATDYYGTMTYTTCHSSDGSGTTTTTSAANCYFTNIVGGSEDCHIALNSALYNTGSDLSADTYYPFNTDFQDNPRSTGMWDVGADEYYVAPIPEVGKRFFKLRANKYLAVLK
jgi:hypothetical protein